MGRIKIAHEAPKSVFKQVQIRTDVDYALVHLFEKDGEYFKLFKEALAQGREVILDNSIFELGKAFDPGRFLDWIIELRPTYYIVPDVLENTSGTINNMGNWMNNYESMVPRECKKIGVVQGNTYSNLVRCYRFMDEVAKVDKIAISFDYSYYLETYPHPNKLMGWMLGRVKLISDLLRDGVINVNKPHHLLGCALPGEGIFYPQDQFGFIESVDSSNPVLHALLGIKYDGPLGLQTKSTSKLADHIDDIVNTGQWDIMKYNIMSFRKLWQGNYGMWNV